MIDKKMNEEIPSEKINQWLDEIIQVQKTNIDRLNKINYRLDIWILISAILSCGVNGYLIYDILTRGLIPVYIFLPFNAGVVFYCIWAAYKSVKSLISYYKK